MTLIEEAIRTWSLTTLSYSWHKCSTRDARLVTPCQQHSCQVELTHIVTSQPPPARCVWRHAAEREELEVIKGELSSRQPVTSVKNVTTVTGCYRGYSYYIRPGKSGAFLEGYSVAFLFHYCNCNTVQQWSASCLVNQKSIKLQLNTSQDCHYWFVTTN